MKPNQSAKRVDIVSIKLVKEGSVRYKGRTIHRPDGGCTLVKKRIDSIGKDFLVVSLGRGIISIQYAVARNHFSFRIRNIGNVTNLVER